MKQTLLDVAKPAASMNTLMDTTMNTMEATPASNTAMNLDDFVDADIDDDDDQVAITPIIFSLSLSSLDATTTPVTELPTRTQLATFSFEALSNVAINEDNNETSLYPTVYTLDVSHQVALGYEDDAHSMGTLDGPPEL
ncbi:hypothetical protein SARC_09952 [Sphaeroforma arctica JP610]|uniref:Uncharacterized protein n=1 Tax=Sphaeroforma arctica JP610 TaxID=667725 RepID=A0A0L0FLG3_9EUKA|nr:hypothetical protein SARC_09952 [Sphaeroforma arctica JP610]KNC77585.1 hypothetical protein SARC_09952 [Sphaeroforma arctica JP610]|eukprot:XP_014151487.1 hypothetical protein SARC_09952 [Sphaeroforma arctica JP610]